MEKKYIILGLILLVILSVLGCKQENENVQSVVSDEVDINNKSDTLVIYMSAPMTTFLTIDENGNPVHENIFSSRHTIGTKITGGDITSPNGNIFEKALEKYEKEFDIRIEVKYLEEYNAEGDILQNIIDSNGDLPDMLLVNRSPTYDYYCLAEQGYLMDLSDVVRDTDTVDEEKEYYDQVLDAGIMFEKQYAIPILFNLNCMMGSKDYLESISQSTEEVNVSYEEILNIIKKSCIECENSETMSAIYETSGYRSNGRYLASILAGAAYPQYFDSTSTNLVVSEEVFASIFRLMKYYNEQEFCMIADWKEKSYIDNINNSNNKTVRLRGMENIDENIGLFLSGGRSGGVSFFNSVLTDAAYFQTVYSDQGDELVLYGIPTVENDETYSANVALTAFAFSSSEKSDEICDLIRFLMDYEFPVQYGFSVNKGITEKQLVDIQKTTISVYPYRIMENANTFKSESDLKSEIIHIDPLNAEYVEIIRNMLDNIEGAGLPYGVLEYHMFNSMYNLVGDETLTPEEAGEWIIKQWEQYLETQLTLQPFYDSGYIQSISLIGSTSE